MICAGRRLNQNGYVAYASFTLVCHLLCIPEQACAQRSLHYAPIPLADLLLPGHRGIEHELVVVESDLFETHRLIAAPTRGLRGVVEIRPGEPFPFSSKYRTRIYVLPEGTAPPEEIDTDLMASWPSCEPPIREIRSVPWFSPVVSALSTCKLVEVRADGLKVELVDHVELDASGNPANTLRRPSILLAVAGIGLLGCGGLYLYRRSRMRGSFELQHPTSDTAT